MPLKATVSHCQSKLSQIGAVAVLFEAYPESDRHSAPKLNCWLKSRSWKLLKSAMGFASSRTGSRLIGFDWSTLGAGSIAFGVADREAGPGDVGVDPA